MRTRRKVILLVAFLALSGQVLSCLAANNSKPTPSTQQSYGQITDTITKIEDILKNGSHNLSDTEQSDYQSRLERLKTDARIDISSGADAECLIAPAASLQNDLASRLKDNASLLASEKRQIDAELVKLEALLAGRASNLTAEHHAELKQSLADLEARANGKLSVADGGAAALMHDVHQLHMEIISKSWIRLASPKSDSQKSDNLKNATEPQKQELHRGHIEESAVIQPTPLTAQPLPRKPMISIPKQMERVENELMTLHEKGQLGTFDMDLYTSKLLAIKKNWNVMIQKSGVLSPRQEYTLRQELEHLNRTISDHILN